MIVDREGELRRRMNQAIETKNPQEVDKVLDEFESGIPAQRRTDEDKQLIEQARVIADQNKGEDEGINQ